MRLWVSAALSPYGNPYGAVAVVAETRREAIAKAREALEKNTFGYAPAQRHKANLLANLDRSMEEVSGGVYIDWGPTR